MSADGKKTLIVILGPTAVGKTAFAIEVAKHFSAEIISADSRQFYKELNIGVARPSAQELAAVNHHFIAFLNIEEHYSAGNFGRDALIKLNDLFGKSDYAVCTGGSMMYVDALLYGFDDLPSDKKLKTELLEKLDTEGIESLQQQLKILDEDYYNQVDLMNPHRLVRAIEVCQLTGKKYSDLRSGSEASRSFRIIKVGLTCQRNYLYKRINDRVDKMINDGLIEEAKGLVSVRHQNAMNTVGYKELFHHFEGNCTLAEATDKIKQHTRNFAKRQLTWWRRDGDINWMDVTERSPSIQFIESLL